MNTHIWFREKQFQQHLYATLGEYELNRSCTEPAWPHAVWHMALIWVQTTLILDWASYIFAPDKRTTAQLRDGIRQTFHRRPWLVTPLLSLYVRPFWMNSRGFYFLYVYIMRILLIFIRKCAIKVYHSCIYIYIYICQYRPIRNWCQDIQLNNFKISTSYDKLSKINNGFHATRT